MGSIWKTIGDHFGDHLGLHFGPFWRPLGSRAEPKRLQKPWFLRAAGGPFWTTSGLQAEGQISRQRLCSGGGPGVSGVGLWGGSLYNLEASTFTSRCEGEPGEVGWSFDGEASHAQGTCKQVGGYTRFDHKLKEPNLHHRGRGRL